MYFLAVTCRVRSNLGSFLPRAARAFKVCTDLLAPGAGCVEIFLCVSLDLRGTAPPCRDFVTKLAEAVRQLGLIDGRGKLLRGEQALRLNRARLAIVALGDIENNRVCVQLWRDVAIDRTGGIVLELGGYKFASGLGRMIPAYAGLGVVFELVEGKGSLRPASAPENRSSPIPIKGTKTVPNLSKIFSLLSALIRVGLDISFCRMARLRYPSGRVPCNS